MSHFLGFFLPQGNSFIGCELSDSSIYMNWGDYRNSPDWDIYFNKTDIKTLTTSANPPLQSSIKIFPNPSKGSIQVSFSLPSSGINPEILIFNSLGQVMKTIPVSLNQSGRYSEQLNISYFSDGVYYLFVKNNNSFFGNSRFVKSGE